MTAPESFVRKSSGVSVSATLVSSLAIAVSESMFVPSRPLAKEQRRANASGRRTSVSVVRAAASFACALSPYSRR